MDVMDLVDLARIVEADEDPFQGEALLNFVTEQGLIHAELPEEAQDILLDSIPPPPGAVEVDEWNCDQDGTFRRMVTFRKWGGEFQGDIFATQDSYGNVSERELWVGDMEVIGADKARAFAAMLQEAADAIDSMSA